MSDQQKGQMGRGPMTRSRKIYEFMIMKTSNKARERFSSEVAQKVKCECGREFKSEKGFKIHEARTGCCKEAVQGHHIDDSGERKEDQSQEAPHRAQDPPCPRQPRG